MLSQTRTATTTALRALRARLTQPTPNTFANPRESELVAQAVSSSESYLRNPEALLREGLALPSPSLNLLTVLGVLAALDFPNNPQRSVSTSLVDKLLAHLTFLQQDSDRLPLPSQALLFQLKKILILFQPKAAQFDPFLAALPKALRIQNMDYHPVPLSFLSQRAFELRSHPHAAELGLSAEVYPFTKLRDVHLSVPLRLRLNSIGRTADVFFTSEKAIGIHGFAQFFEVSVLAGFSLDAVVLPSNASGLEAILRAVGEPGDPSGHPAPAL